MSIIAAREKRSRLYHAIAAIRPVNDVRTTRLDVWGSVVVPVLLVGVVNLVRLLLQY